MLLEGNYTNQFLGDTPVETVVKDLIGIIGEEFGTDDRYLEPAVCETLDGWRESGQTDLMGLASDIRRVLEIDGSKAANNVFWYLVRLECKEGRVL